MVVLSKIYTRGGDQGKTSLGDGGRVAKYSTRVEAYGTVDEANAVIGLARLETADHPEIEAILARVSNDLFDVGADLCTPHQDAYKYPPLRITDGQVAALEADIDRFNEPLQPLNSFILPGGSRLSAHLHLCRTVVRRAERLVTRLSDEEVINAEVIRYLNRLSDLMFVLSRTANENGKRDVLWVPGANRD